MHIQWLMFNDASHEDVEKQVDRCINLLMEYAEAVQILVTYPTEEGHTCHNFRGAGNWYARQGMAHEFVNMDQAQTQAVELAKKLPPPTPPDEGDEWKAKD